MKIKRILATALSALMLAGAFACDGGEKGGENTVEFWQTYATLKVFQDYPDAYEDVKFDAVINLDVARGGERVRADNNDFKKRSRIRSGTFRP